MEFWISFWGAVLVVGMLVFLCVAAVVTVGGFADVKAMFRGIDSQHDDATTNQGGT